MTRSSRSAPDPAAAADRLVSLLSSARHKRAALSLSDIAGQSKEWLSNRGGQLKDWLSDPTHGHLRSSLVGAGVGGGLGLLSSLRRDKEERQPWQSALTGAAAGGLLGLGGSLLRGNVGKAPEQSSELEQINSRIAEIEQARRARHSPVLPRSWTGPTPSAGPSAGAELDEYLQEQAASPPKDPGRHGSLVGDYLQRAGLATAGVAALDNTPGMMMRRGAPKVDLGKLTDDVAEAYRVVNSGQIPWLQAKSTRSLLPHNWFRGASPSAVHSDLTHSEVRRMMGEGARAPNRWLLAASLGIPALMALAARNQHNAQLERWLGSEFQPPASPQSPPPAPAAGTTTT